VAKFVRGTVFVFVLYTVFELLAEFGLSGASFSNDEKHPIVGF
jgi:hypothetical protein